MHYSNKKAFNQKIFKNVQNLSLSANIRYFRKKNGWNQIQLGERLKLSGSQISLYESGKSLPGLSTLDDMATLFDVSVGSLFDVDFAVGETLIPQAEPAYSSKSLKELRYMVEKLMECEQSKATAINLLEALKEQHTFLRGELSQIIHLLK